MPSEFMFMDDVLPTYISMEEMADLMSNSTHEPLMSDEEVEAMFAWMDLIEGGNPKDFS